jgi:anaerobic magnesium-protoporphyrin IX monomethyl ester cyclase
MFSKVVVVNPPNPPGYISNKDSMGGFGQLFPLGATLFPPLDLFYLASYLVDKKYDVEVLESLAHDLDRGRLLARISAGSQALIVVRTSAPTLDSDLEVCTAMKQKAPGVSIALYGPVVPSVKRRIEREAAIDYIIAGDPEPIVEALLKSSKPAAATLNVVNQEESELAGLTFRKGDGWVETTARPFTRELDTLPFPKWELVPYQRYRLPKSSARAEVPFLPMLTSRGCPIGCHYCPYPVGQGLPWRYRSAKNVLDEIEHLVRGLGIQYVLFRDPMFSLNQKRVIEICDGIAERGLHFTWRCETRIDFLNPPTLEAMAKAGCEGINFGVESADIEIQKGVGRKPIEQAEFLKCFALCRKLGIKTFAFFIIGLPGDTVETIMSTIEFAIRMKPTWMQFTAASPFIGTKLRDWAVGQGLVTDDEYAYINSHGVMIGNDHLSKEQVQSLYRFARLIQVYLLNRRGILKDDRQSMIYSLAKNLADTVSVGLARIVFALGRKWFARGGTPTRPKLAQA